MLSRKTKMGLPAEITDEDRAEHKKLYGEMLRGQALAFIEYDTYLKSDRKGHLNIEGLTWIITKKGPEYHNSSIVATLTVTKGGSSVQLLLDPTLFPSNDDPLAQTIQRFFMSELRKSISDRS